MSERTRLVEVDVEEAEVELVELNGRRYCNGDVIFRFSALTIRWSTLILFAFHVGLLIGGVLTWIPEFIFDLGIRSFTLSPLSIVWLFYASIWGFILLLFVGTSLYDRIYLGSRLADKVIPMRRRVTLRRLGCVPSRLSLSRDWSQWLVFVLVAIALFAQLLVLFGNIFLLVPQFNLVQNGEVERIFGKGGFPPSPFSTPFSFGPYLYPGPLELFGPYKDNTDNPHEVFLYKNGCIPNCTIHVYNPFSPPKNGTLSPVLFHIHGGSYISGKPGLSATPFGYWLERGYAVTSMTYSFLNKKPNVTFFDIFNDGEDGWKFFKQNAAAWGLDPTRVVMFGESAGGGMAVMTAYKANDTGIKGVFNMYGFEELEYYWDHSRGGYADVFILKGLQGNTSRENLRLASASYLITPNTPPTLSMHGTWDGMVPFSQSTHLHEKLTEKGVKNLLIPAPSYGHILDFGWFSAGGQLTRYTFEHFLASVLLK